MFRFKSSPCYLLATGDPSLSVSSFYKLEKIIIVQVSQESVGLSECRALGTISGHGQPQLMLVIL